MVRAWLIRANPRLIVSDLAGLEFVSVVSRALRTGRLNRAEAELALATLDEIRGAAIPSGHNRDDFELAGALVRDFADKLAAAEALHLATAANAGAVIATLDMRLSSAALRHGVETVGLERTRDHPAS